MSENEGRETVRLYTRKPKEVKKKEPAPIARPPTQQAASSNVSFLYKNRAAFVALFIANVSLGGYLLYDILVVKKQARDAAEAEAASNTAGSSPLVAATLAPDASVSTQVEAVTPTSASSLTTAVPPPGPAAASIGSASLASPTPEAATSAPLDQPPKPPSSPPASSTATVSSVAEIQPQVDTAPKPKTSEQSSRVQLSVAAAPGGRSSGVSAPLSEKERRHVLLWVLKHKRQARPGSDVEKLLVDEDKRVLKEYLNTPGKLMGTPFAKLEPGGMSDREKRKVLQWVLDEKRKVKPSSPEEKTKVDGEKAVIKEYLGHWWKLPTM